MNINLRFLLCFIAVFSLSFRLAHAEEGKPPAAAKGRPAIVELAPLVTGEISDEIIFSGTVFYKEVSEVAAEVSGKVKSVYFDEGQSVKEGGLLLRLDSELLRKSIDSTEADYGKALADLGLSENDLKRIEGLFKEEFVSERDYDESRFRVEGLKKTAESLKAELDRSRVELKKKSIRAPFDGVVIGRDAWRGEWIAPGARIATIAATGVMEVVVEVPEEVMLNTTPGTKAAVFAGGRKFKGTVSAVVPRGDLSSRTFPIKILVRDSAGLIEGMSAKAALPNGAPKPALIVSRDAVIINFGRNVVYASVDGVAKMVPVTVVGYSGMKAGVESPELKAGMRVVIKGNERLRDGQPLVSDKARK